MSLPRTGLGTTSLGAVGGARGTAAGGIRILVEFLTQYDSKAVKQLEADLATLEAQESSASAKAISAVNAQNTAEQRLLSTRAEIAKIIATATGAAGSKITNATANRRLKEIQSVGILTKEGQKRLSILDRDLALGGQLVKQATTRARLEKALNGLLAANVKNTRAAADAAKEQTNATRGQLTNQNAIKSALPARLGGLALGAVGGIFGGALIGVGFAAAEEALKLIEERLRDIIDPGRHAREIIRDLGAEINKMAVDGVTRLQAAKQILDELNIAADDATAALLAATAGQEQASRSIEEFIKINELRRHGDALSEENVKTLEKELVRQAIAAGTLTAEQRGLAAAHLDAALEATFQTQALEMLGTFAGVAANNVDRLALANQEAAATAQIAAFAFERFSNAIGMLVASQASGIDTKIQNLQDNSGPSKRTLALEAALEKAQGGGGGDGGARARELANIREERALILLRQRLRLLGTNIDLEKYSGKFLLEAINAKQKALEKEAAAQDRLNKLLDLQYRMAQKIRRNEGESINDFLERRAQENRGFLEEQRDLEREKTEERLQELEDKTADEVKLAELAEREKTQAATSGGNARARELQKELAASRKKDAQALKSQIAALEEQKRAFAAKANDVIRMSAEEEQEKVRLAIRGIKTVEQLATVSAKVQGTVAALGFIESFGSVLVASGAITQGELNGIIRNLQNTLSAWHAAERNLFQSRIVGGKVFPGKFQTSPHFAGGGLISLNNARNPFGGDRQFGEQGSETALILSNKITQSLRENGRGVGDMNFYMDRTDDPLKDKYWLKKTVKEAVSEVLR